MSNRRYFVDRACELCHAGSEQLQLGYFANGGAVYFPPTRCDNCTAGAALCPPRAYRFSR
jgi:hypothetical protein